MKLKDKVAIVTGSGQGIGKEVALTLAREGANVVVSDITDKVYDMVKEIEKMGSQGLAVKADVSNIKEVEEMVRKILEKFGRIDILVNNAGIYPFKSLVEMEEKDWDKVLNVNLKGTFNCTKSVLQTMIKQKSGVIINISSIAGSVVGYSNLVHYSASKSGIVGFTRSAALELAQHGIRMNAIAPGPIETPGIKAVGEESLKQIVKTVPLKRIGQPRDVANLVVFLASEDSNFITGQCIVIDGGYTLP